MTAPIAEAIPEQEGQAPPGTSTAPTGLRRWHVGLVLWIISVALPVFQASGVGVFWSLLSMSALVAVAIAPSTDSGTSTAAAGLRLTWIAWLPAAFVGLVFSAMSIATVTAWVAPHVLGTRWGALAVWVLLASTTLATAVRRGGRVAVARSDVAAGAIGALFAAAGVVVATAQPLSRWSRIPSGGTDFNRHIIMLRGIVEDGGLTYAQNTYPRGLHALVALDWSASGGAGFSDAFRGLSATLWLMIVLMAVAASVVVFRGCLLLGIGGRVLTVAAGAILLLAFAQSMWITAMLRMGFVTSVLAGLVLISIASASLDKGGTWFGSPWSIGFIAVCGAVLAQGWTLIVPAMAMLGLLSCFISIRGARRGVLNWRSLLGPALLVTFCVAISIPAVRSLAVERSGAAGLQESLATPGGSGLEPPQFWWWIALVLAALAAVLLWRAGAGRFALMSFFTVAIGAVTVALVARAGVGALGGLNYYALKSMWTYSIVVLPLGIVGGMWVVSRARDMINSMAHGLARSAATAGALGLVVLIAAGVAGRISGTPSKTLEIVNGRLGTFAIAIPVVSFLDEQGMDNADGLTMPDVVVWGIIPNSTLSDMAAGAPGMYDWIARESTSWLALTNFSGSPMTRATMLRNVTGACDYLRERPDAVRITGPNPAAGAPWLLDGGCPTDVVKPEQWLSIPIADEWLEGSYLTQRPFVYPTYAEFQQFMADRQAAKPTAASTDGVAS